MSDEVEREESEGKVTRERERDLWREKLIIKYKIQMNSNHVNYTVTVATLDI